jgi:hypothetical protein
VFNRCDAHFVVTDAHHGLGRPEILERHDRGKHDVDGGTHGWLVPVVGFVGFECLAWEAHALSLAGVFAAYLRSNVRTLENWKQGQARPNAQAALLNTVGG